MARLLKVVALVAALCAWAPAARAQNGANNFGLQLFRPAVDSKGYITVNASQILGHLDWSIGLVATYAHQVMNFQQTPGQPTSVGNPGFGVTDLLTPQVQAALGLFKWVEIGVSIPVNIMFGQRTPGFTSPTDTNQNNTLSFSGQGLGDIGFHPKVRILNTSKYPVGLGILASIYAPSSNANKFLGAGEGQVTIRPEIILDKEFGFSRRVKLALNVGALIRPGQQPYTDTGATIMNAAGINGGQPFCQPGAVTESPAGSGMYTAPLPGMCGTGITRSLGTQITYGLGLSIAVVKGKFDLLGELYGYADVHGNTGGYPLEGILAGKVYLAKNSYFQFGGGAGLLPSSGNSLQPMTGSPQARVFIGFIFEPHIGDRDGDGIKDDVDKCPDDPEDLDDFEDSDGCPDPDNDRDGILDKDDKCPNEPETKNGFEDDDGCPDSLDLDRDGDGIPDRVDKCPDDPEDKDGFEDDDGCPDPDNDKDRILDKDDKCPNEPEVYNGFEDEDGCPDKGRVIVRKGNLEILDKIYFETDKAVIKPISYPILDAIAGTMKGNPQILLIEVQGHADERGDDDHNMKLTEDRAAAVKTYLVEHGVEADRLQSHGFGETKPALQKGSNKPCVSHNESCWSLNRRVEFVILRRSDNPAPDSN